MIFIAIVVIVVVLIVIAIAVSSDNGKTPSPDQKAGTAQAQEKRNTGSVSANHGSFSSSIGYGLDNPSDLSGFPYDSLSPSMHTYANYGGDSSIRGYQTDSSGITVTFSDGSVYRYTASSVGSYNLEEMKRLAERGEGLNSYIMRNCKYDYESKQQGGGFVSDDSSWFDSGFDDGDW